MATDNTPPQSHPLDAQKTALRARARLTRNAIPSEQRAADALRVAERGLPISAGTPGVLGAYSPTAKEFDCRPLVERLAPDGWTIALPTIAGDAPLVFRRWRFGEPLVRGPRDIMEPAAGDSVRPALLLIPLLAFDAAGYRLGYGGGHYDRTLDALRRDGPVLAVGVAFDAQEVAQLPVGPHDQRLDWILTPSGARRF